MGQADKDNAVRLLIGEMKDRILRATPETREYETRVVLALSGIVVTLQPEVTAMSLLPSFP